jgi:hypothetical protein
VNRKTFPKEGIKKDRQTIRDLKALISKLEKEIRFLQRELLATMKPGRDPKPDKSDTSFEEWRKDFLARFKKEVLGK